MDKYIYIYIWVLQLSSADERAIPEQGKIRVSENVVPFFFFPCQCSLDVWNEKTSSSDQKMYTKKKKYVFV